jgi:hypothetical protein
MLGRTLRLASELRRRTRLGLPRTQANRRSLEQPPRQTVRPVNFLLSKRTSRSDLRSLAACTSFRRGALLGFPPSLVGGSKTGRLITKSLPPALCMHLPQRTHTKGWWKKRGMHCTSSRSVFGTTGTRPMEPVGHAPKRRSLYLVIPFHRARSPVFSAE